MAGKAGRGSRAKRKRPPGEGIGITRLEDGGCVRRRPQRHYHPGQRQSVLSCPTAWEWELRFNQLPANLSRAVVPAFLRTGTGLGTEAGFMNSGSGGVVPHYAGGKRKRILKKRERKKCNLAAGQMGIDVKMRVGHTCK